jgi:glycerate-2-kinase
VQGDRIAVQARDRQQLIATYCCEWTGLGRPYAAQGFFLLIKTSHTMLASNPRQLLLQLFESAVDAVSATRCLPSLLQQEAPRGRTLVIGAGKGVAEMAKVVEDCWPHALSGLVITPYGHGADCRRIEVIEAAHPVPDEAGRRGAQRLLEMVGGLTEDDLVICLISGGGSSLLAMPVDGMSLAQKQAINSALLKSGAMIAEINCVRKHRSAIKGGRLALACAPARLITLLISDVPGDDPGIVASGPTLPDATTVWPSRSMVVPTCMRWRAIPTASTARSITPVRSAAPIPLPEDEPLVWTPWPCSTTTMPIASSRGSVDLSLPARPARTSMTSAPS